MTTANKVTILRILLIPFFVVQILYYFRTGDELHRTLGLLSFAVAAILDGVDGYIARHYNQKSELGAMLDPLGDKLLLVSGIVLLSFTNQTRLRTMPLWLTATIISRDVLLVLGWAVIHLMCGKVTVRPRMLGKIATVFQMATVLWILLKWKEAFLPYLIWGALFSTAGSGLLYIWDGMRQLSASPSSSPHSQQ
ncbi:CDP-alcohol phosphatidyltransferase family protein [Pedosphaera parvula]|uniref:CDP-diacylglycerol--glycerol-3-phosphate 3-phosphatidyltransferase n=1 Tax=Pedosphaera parvula (strain Ellin514) TaxID=320771 RepID=B9XJ18_PEDPL|nr:CDP-alcohol phosphatidyltransferase family protein [Pedosphaera parvula]EEF60245.1 CDP-alcohol phosphatidyltransferase [Pedosphaera parvula Ellin514]